MNFGHGRFGLAFWPMAKSKPDPEYSTVFSGPIAFDALSMRVLASCPKAVVVNSNTTTRTYLRISLLRLSHYDSFTPDGGKHNYGNARVAESPCSAHSTMQKGKGNGHTKAQETQEIRIPFCDFCAFLW